MNIAGKADLNVGQMGVYMRRQYTFTYNYVYACACGGVFLERPQHHRSLAEDSLIDLLPTQKGKSQNARITRITQ